MYSWNDLLNSLLSTEMELVQDFGPVPAICKFEEDLI